MQIALLQRLPLVAVEPDTFAALAMIECEVEAVPDQILDHAEATLRAIHIPARLGERQSLVLNRALRQVGPVLFEPLPVLSPAYPVPAASGAFQSREARLQLRREELGRLADRTVHC